MCRTITFTTCQTAFWKYNILKVVHQIKIQSWLLQKLYPSVLTAEEQSILSIFMSIYAVKFKLILGLIYRHDYQKSLIAVAGTHSHVPTTMSPAQLVLFFSPALTLSSRGSSSGHFFFPWNVSGISVWVKRDKKRGDKEQIVKTSSNEGH